ncbi:hypothetical protein LCGC14_2305910 [marine sediment metagenome]|uniref:Uncharacterized protein n=1 Tax=marine sediment metagenome TaxID=412755 RepID=A0A0F9D9K5_9ZZZZ
MEVDLNGGGNSLYNFASAFSDPTHASMLADEIVVGNIGDGNTQGRIWVRSGNRVYRFDSVAAYA